MNTVRFFLLHPLLTMNNGEGLVAGGHGKHATLRVSHDLACFTDNHKEYNLS